MDVSGVATSATALTQADTTNAVQMAVLKKVLDFERQSAQQLIAGITPGAYNNPPNLGNGVDTYA
jgi:hypothetical protein